MTEALHPALAALAGDMRAAAAIALVLVLPGMLIFAWVAGRPGRWFEWIVAGLATSQAVTIVTGLVLNRLPEGLVPRQWWLVLSLLCGVAAPLGLATVLRVRRAARRMPIGRASLARAAVVGLSAIVAAFAIVLARSGAEAHREYAYTNVWILPQAGPNPSSAVVGIENRERTSQVYALEIMANGAVIGLIPDLRLAPGERLVQPVAVPRQGAGETMIEARLFLEGRPDLVYRRVWLRLAAPPSPDIAARIAP